VSERVSDGFDAEVIVVGYGPTGVTAANMLGLAGISTIVLEREEAIYPRARAVTVNDWTMRCFQAVGLRDEILENLDVTEALRWITYDGRELTRTVFAKAPQGQAPSYAIYQPLMEQALRAGVERFRDHVTVRFGVDVTDVTQDGDGVAVTATSLATGEVITKRAKYVLACDGGSSRVRSAVGAQLSGDTGSTVWLIIDARVKRWWPNRHILTFWSDKQRPVVDIALARGNHRWEVPLRPEEKESDFQTHDDLWRVLGELGVSPDDVELHQHAFYRHHNRMADRWRVDRVFLIGDAAHLMPPWAGSGMQSGIRDVNNLCWKLIAVLGGLLPDAVLDSYQVERQPSVGFFTFVSEFLGRIIKQELTDEELKGVMPVPGEPAPPSPLMIPPSIDAGWLTGAGTPGSVVGKFLPQSRTASAQGIFGYLDDFLPTGFVLLGDNVHPAALLSNEDRDAWLRLGAKLVAVRGADQHALHESDLIDIDGDLVGWMREFGAKVIVVRPDRFIAAADPTGLSVPSL
jgi:3-(3-hydroxy-phenyl)propionate hydroxylase